MTFIRCADTIGQHLTSLSRLPYWRQRLLGSYTTRTFAASAAAWATVPDKHEVRIDQAPTNELFGGARVKDVEPGAAHISNVVALARAGHRFVEYCPQLEAGASLGESRAALHAAGVADRVHFWVANWGFNELEAANFIRANPDVVGVQWASPSSNPNAILPGSGGLTLRQANVDLSIMRAEFWLPQAPPAPTPKPPQGAQGEWHAELVFTPQNGRATVRGRPGKHVKMADHPSSRQFVITVDEQHGRWHAQ